MKRLFLFSILFLVLSLSLVSAQEGVTIGKLTFPSDVSFIDNPMIFGLSLRLIIAIILGIFFAYFIITNLGKFLWIIILFVALYIVLFGFDKFGQFILSLF